MKCRFSPTHNYYSEFYIQHSSAFGFFFKSLLEDMFLLVLETEKGWQRERRRNINVGKKQQLVPPTCTSTGAWTCNLGVCPDGEWNLQPFVVWDDGPTVPPSQGTSAFLYNFVIYIFMEVFKLYIKITITFIWFVIWFLSSTLCLRDSSMLIFVTIIHFNCLIVVCCVIIHNFSSSVLLMICICL